MSRLSETLERIDRVMSERRSTFVNRAAPPVARGGSTLPPRLVYVAGFTGILCLAFVLVSYRGWTRLASDQSSAPTDLPAVQAAVAVPSGVMTLPLASSPPTRGEGQGGGAQEQLHRQGMRAVRSGDYEGAEVAFRHLLVLNPTAAEVHNNLGVVYIQRGALQKGIAAFRSALRLAPGYAEAALNLAVALERQGEVAEATTYYRRFLALAGAERRLERERVVKHLALGGKN